MVSEHASPLAAIGGVDAGGQNIHVAALARALASRGHEVTVYTRRDDPALAVTVPFGPGVVVRHLNAGPVQPLAKDELLAFVPELTGGLVEDWQRNRPDVVHSHFWMSGLAACAASRAMPGVPLPVIHTYHALGVVKRRELGEADTSPASRVDAEADLGGDADAIIATCADEVGELKALGVPPDKVSVVPCGVDLATFTPNGPAEGRGARRRIAVIGRLVPRKGIDTTIDAVALVTKRGRHDVELIVVGGASQSTELAPDREVKRLTDLARAKGVLDRVTFRGQLPQDRLPALLRSLDTVVCTPWYEPFGIVPLEAMGCAVPVIAARVGGLKDTVVDGRTGILVPPRDPTATADAVEQVLVDPVRAAAFGRAGRRRVRERYSWPRVARETERVYVATMDRAAQYRQAWDMSEVAR
jgi:D-inositol-3-phosphate glycosyltransferase